MDEWINKTWHMHTVKYYSILKKRTTVLCYSIDKPWGHYAKWNMLVIEQQILDYFTYMMHLK